MRKQFANVAPCATQNPGDLMAYQRGNVYFVKIGADEKPYLVVSNNRRNLLLGSALGVRITTTRKPVMASVIALPPDETVVGSVLCDDIETLYDSDPSRHAGALTPATMRAVGEGLKAALSLN